MSSAAHQPRFDRSLRRTNDVTYERRKHDALLAELQAAQIRERLLLARVYALSHNKTAITDDRSDNEATNNNCLNCSLHHEKNELSGKLYDAGLTQRERQVFRLVLAGCPSKNIAFDLGISQRTVENHRASIMKKTGCKSLPALGRMAFAFAGNG